MDKIKAFLQKKKLDVKFKTAGKGQALTSASAGRKVPQQPQISRQPVDKDSVEAQKSAAEAALKRLQVTQKQHQTSRHSQSIKAQAKKALEQEAQQSGNETQDHSHTAGPAVQEFESAPVLAVSGVFFTCELLGEDVYLTKDDMCEAVEAFLRDSLAEDALVSSCMMIFSLNPIPTQRDGCIEVLNKYLDNLIQSPHEEKFRKIRLTNRIFQEKIAGIKGAVEFLHSLGFSEIEENGEKFLIVPLDLCKAENLVMAKECLHNSSPIPLKLYRNPVVLIPSAEPLAELSLPADFFARTTTEVKSEQHERAAEVDKLLTLRTREMREKDELKRLFKYKFTLVRIRFPDGFMLQGTFYSAEKIEAVEAFIRQHIIFADFLPFLLKDARGEPFKGVKLEKTLAELSLSPASVLHFEPDPDFVRNYAEAGQQLPEHYLLQDLIDEATEDSS